MALCVWSQKYLLFIFIITMITSIKVKLLNIFIKRQSVIFAYA